MTQARGHPPRQELDLSRDTDEPGCEIAMLLLTLTLTLTLTLINLLVLLTTRLLHYGPERTNISCAPVTAKSSTIPAPHTSPQPPPPPPTMLGPSSSAIPDRPNRPLVVKCGYENSTRRINFPSAASCRLDSLRTRVGGLISFTSVDIDTNTSQVEECFHLSASPFFLVYLDDDGEEFSIRNEADLTEAIAYFISGDDDQALSTYSGGSGANPSRPLPFSSQKITIRLDIVVEYDGPSLSDTSSLSSFRTGEGESEDGQSEGSWRSSGYEESYRSYGRNGLGQDVISEEEEGLTEYGGSYRGSVAASMREALNDSLADLTIQPRLASGSGSGSGTGTSRRSDTARAASTRGSASQHSSGRTVPSNAPLTGPESAPAPSLLTHSELGTRWLREQSRLVRRKVGPGSGFNGSARRYDSDDESIGSDEESLGDLALVRDARGSERSPTGLSSGLLG